MRQEEELVIVWGLGNKLKPMVKKRLSQMAETGTWLMRLPSRLEGTQLMRDEWLNNVHLWYAFRPKGLPQQCNGCGANFSIDHAFNWNKGGLVT